VKVHPQRATLGAYSPHWATPKEIYAELDSEFGFTLDPCPLGGLVDSFRSWQSERIYCNPPYGRGIGDWVARWPEAALAVYLLPSRTDTAWFHRCLREAAEIRFIRGRLKFGTATSNAPFPSIVVIFKP
jgi:DNA N-6-adenine-methyltransferase Dam